MNIIFVKVYYFLMLVIVSLLLTSCSEPDPQNKNQQIQEVSLDYIQKSSIISRGERVEGAWTTPELLGTELIRDYSISNFYGPLLSLNNNSNGFAAWRLDGLLNNSGTYQSGTSIYKFESNSAGWINESSVLNLDANFSSFPDIQTDDTSGVSSALWSSNGALYLKAYDSSNSWKETLMVGSTPFSGNMYVTPSGNAVIYWPSKLIDGTWVLNARRYVFSTNTLTPLIQLPRFASNTEESVSILTITAAQQTNNSSLFVWRENTNNALTNRVISSSLYSAKYDIQTGWSSVQAVTGLAANTQIDTLTLATELTKDEAKLVLLYPLSNPGQNIGSIISYENGIWLPSTSIVNSGPGLRKNTTVKVNNKGDIIIAWSELLFESSGLINQINVKQYSPETSWSGIKIVSDQLPFIPSSSSLNTLHVDYPAVTLNESGNAAIAWLDSTQAAPEVFINHYSPTTRWGTQQLVAVISGQIKNNLEVHLDGNNKSSVMWVDSKQTSVGEEYNIWVSSYSLQGNIISPLPNGQNPVATAGLPEGHALISIGCIDCHDGVTAISQPSSHIPTTAECNACHSPVAWRPIIVVDHNEVIGLCESCHNGTVASGKTLTHFASSDSCDGCHSTIIWTPVIVVDHSQVSGTCNSCHNNTLAIGKSASHVQSSEQCETCHSTFAWLPLLTGPPITTGPFPQPALPQTGLPQDHASFIADCILCHNGSSASTKNIAHMPTTDQCSACHSPLMWQPVVTLMHTDVIGTCESCHNNLIARGKSPFHIATNGSCDSCHSTINWFSSDGVFDHSQVVGTCLSCHNGVTAIGKNTSHILSSGRCEVCHAVTAWLPLIIDLPPQTPPSTSLPQGHNSLVNNCSSCHNSVTATGKNVIHIPATDTCESCHSNLIWRPVIKVDHNEALGSCVNCHNGVLAVGKSPFHMPTSTGCENCHLTTSWLANTTVPGNSSVFDHTQALGSCVNCHNGLLAAGKGVNHITSSNLCDACHSVVLWVSVIVDHNEVIGACESCHATPLAHSIVTINTVCDSCHATITWLNPTNILP